MTRAWNFSAGPAALPEAVLLQAQQEMLDYQGRGLSVMEMSHRSAEFIDIAESAERDLRALMGIGDDYSVLFLQGGATLQFAMVPLNLLGERTVADYVDTGQWSAKAIKEAGRYCDVNVVASGRSSNFAHIPPFAEWQRSADAAYLHITLNETIGGVEFFELPDAGATPLVADASSNILSRPLDINRFALLYAGAQKNLGPAGITIVVLRKDLLGNARAGTPSMLDYAVHAGADSMSNTPPTYAWYLTRLVLAWIIEQGGVEEMERRNRQKAQTLYSAIEASNFYRCPVSTDVRSNMNVAFTLADPALDSAFLQGAEARGMLNLKGHRSVGGMRASLYNAVPQEAVDVLVDYLREFERDHGV